MGTVLRVQGSTGSKMDEGPVLGLLWGGCLHYITIHLKRHEHVTSVFTSLHWLPVRSQIDFEILLLTFKALNSLTPKYIIDLLTWYVPS